LCHHRVAVGAGERQAVRQTKDMFRYLAAFLIACHPPAPVETAAPIPQEVHRDSVEQVPVNNNNSVSVVPPIVKLNRDVKPPKIISRVDAKVPVGAQCRSQVRIVALIDESGKPRDVRDATVSPDAFTQATAEAFKQWKFKPATLHGSPVAFQFHSTIDYHCR
jgi:hypothetical protein